LKTLSTLLKLRAIDDTALLTPSGRGRGRANLLRVAQEAACRAGGERSSRGEDEILRWRIMPRQLLTFDAEDLDRHAAVRRYPVAQRLARPLREADRDVVGACRGANNPCANSGGRSSAIVSVPTTQALLLAWLARTACCSRFSNCPTIRL